MAMASPTDFIEVVEIGLGAGEFLEGEARDLRHHIIDGRLEARGRDLRDVVGELVQRVADGELGGDLGDRKPRRFRRQRGGTRDARVHLDDDHPPVGRVDRELHVRAAEVSTPISAASTAMLADRMR